MTDDDDPYHHYADPAWLTAARRPDQMSAENEEGDKERVDVWLEPDDMESLNFIRFKHGGATKSVTVRTCIRLVRHWIETGMFLDPLP
jgi:hypothetical protein